MKNNLLASPNIEYKNFHFEIKAIDENQGIIEGYLSTFSNVDYQKDRVQRGAFKKTLTEAKSRMSNQGKKYLWPVLWMHSPEQPIGGCIDAYEDDRGLYTKFQLDISRTGDVPNNPLAVMVFSGYKSGFIDEQSMGYEAIQKGFDGGIRDLKEVRVWEESCVTSLFAANNQAVATGVKNIMTEKTTAKPQRKDFDTLFQASQAADCLEDLGDLLNTFIQATIQAFGMGDQPQQDMQQCVEQFGAAVGQWTEAAVACNLKDYIAERGFCGDDTPYVPYSMRVGGYDYASRHDDIAGKVGATISQATQGTLEQHQQDMSSHLSAMAEHVKAMQKSTSNLGGLWQDDGKSFTRREPPRALTREQQPLHKSTATDDDDLTIDELASIL